MLTLTRRKNQAIIIGEDISVYIIEVREDRVQLAIHAPPDISVVRTRNVSGAYTPESREERLQRLWGEIKSEVRDLARQFELICARLEALQRDVDNITQRFDE